MGNCPTCGTALSENLVKAIKDSSQPDIRCPKNGPSLPDYDPVPELHVKLIDNKFQVFVDENWLDELDLVHFDG